MKMSTKIIALAIIGLLAAYGDRVNLDNSHRWLCAGIILALIYLWFLRRKGPMREPITQAVKNQVLRRQGGTCSVCTDSRTLDFHHKQAVADGGRSTADNIVALCPTCHALYTRKIQSKN